MRQSLTHYNQLVLLALLFLLPVGGAWYCLHFMPRTQLHFINHGELRQRPTNVVPIINDGLWKVIYFQPQVCDQDCVEMQRNLLNLRLALGGNQDRITILPVKPDQIEHQAGGISVIDPQGIEVLYYQPATELRYVLLDIKRLLKYSHALKK